MSPQVPQRQGRYLRFEQGLLLGGAGSSWPGCRNSPGHSCFTLVCAPAHLSSSMMLPRGSHVCLCCTNGFQNTFSCYSCSPLWSMRPFLGCRLPQCSAEAGHHTLRWHRAARSLQPPRLGCGLSSWDGTSPSGWRPGRTLPPRSGNHLHRSLLLKLKPMRPLA